MDTSQVSSSIGELEGNIQSCSGNEPSPTTQTKASTRPPKRKQMKERSVVWNHFEKILDTNGKLISAKCNYCPKVFASDSIKNGTSSLRNHMGVCINNPNNANPSQSLINLQPSESNVGTLSSWKYDYEEIRKAIAQMVIIDEFPFKFVEGKGFKLKHKGEYLGKSLEACVLDWGLKNIFTITVDNASANDTALSFLKKRMMNWGGSVAACEHLHMRCIAHVINLVVSEGLKELDPSVKRVRDAVRYIRNSPSRLRKFKECVEYEGIVNNNSLCLDVSTRWNSTYLMLKTAEIFEKAFEKYETDEPNYVVDLGDNGYPMAVDWVRVRKIADLLKPLYEMTLRVSGSLYVTASSFFSELSELCCMLNEWKVSDDLFERRLGLSMSSKFDKYWGDHEKMNKLIFWANVFDPTDKFEFMEYTLPSMYGPEKSSTLIQNLKDGLLEMYKEYEKKSQPEDNVNGSGCESGSGSVSVGASDCQTVNVPILPRKAQYKKLRVQSGGSVNKKTELELYLNENCVEADNLDLLLWWKVNSARFPVLSKMARDILAIPISTVASESAFSTSGRVLDEFRSSLTPKLVEALVCTQDWLRGSEKRINFQEQIEELEKFENELSTGTSLSTTKN